MKSTREARLRAKPGLWGSEERSDPWRECPSGVPPRQKAPNFATFFMAASRMSIASFFTSMKLESGWMFFTFAMAPGAPRNFAG
jgi:hypothetical protein